MIAYKGFDENLICTLGRGKFQYEPGETIREESSKCANRGMHCAEYVLDCLDWYPLGRGNRYFRVEASGSLDEDDVDTKIACTEMTLLKELSVPDIALHAMSYMIDHPHRKWVKNGPLLNVAADKALGAGPGSIAIARGKDPRVKGKTGSVMGILMEGTGSEIEEAKYLRVDGKKIKPDTWYRIGPGGLEEAYETKTD